MQPLLTITQLAEFLGMSRQSIYNRRCSGGPDDLPPCIQIGGIVRYRPSDVESWLIKAPRESKSEIDKPKSITTPPKRRGRPTKAEEIKRRKQFGASHFH